MQKLIEAAWNNRELLKEKETQQCIREVIDLLDKGKLRVAEPANEGWTVNEWIKKAVILYFPIQKMETIELGIFEFTIK
jgi:2,3,4,5-tetrahydropyridine-2-carboxylate N-succinyltransferase